jgi:shikimate dehydrogenase
MRISGHTRPFAVLGHPIGHTLSPVMHNAAMAELKLDAIYLAFDVKPEKLMGVLESMRDMGFCGVNLTIPLKEVAARNLKQLDRAAQMFGAVNTVEFAPAGLVGHNTDGYGYIKALDEAFGKKVKGDNVFVLGSGGAGRAVALISALEGAASITIADIDKDRCLAVAGEIKKLFPAVEVRMAATRDEQVAASKAADLVVQATPVGMKPDDKPILGPEAFTAGQRAFDLIYMYPETVFMKAAKQGGACAANGLGMLLHQGAKAFEIWTRIDAPVEVMRKALEAVVYRK